MARTDQAKMVLALEADTPLVIEAMRDHLALCEAGRVMTALAGVEMSRWLRAADATTDKGRDWAGARVRRARPRGDRRTEAGRTASVPTPGRRVAS